MVSPACTAEGIAMEKITLNKEGLAELLGFEKSTMNRKVSDEPETLPPFINVGTEARRKPVWLVETVTQWLKEREGLSVAAASQLGLSQKIESAVTELAPAKRRRGRPKKSEGMALQLGRSSAGNKSLSIHKG